MFKRISLVSAIILTTQAANAQSWQAASGNLVTTATNNVGINTASPVDRLTVNDGDISFTSSVANTFRSINARTSAGALNITTNATTGTNNTGPYIQMYGTANGWRQGGIWYYSWAQNTAPSYGNAHIFQNFNTTTGTATNLLSMKDENGYAKVTIGDVPSLPTGYSLFVQHGIITEKLKIALTTGGDWADYVFDKQYKLRTLPELEAYIRINKHLPNIPAAGEVVAEGIDVAAMNAKLLEKIEELTLYIIAQQKQLDQQQQQLNILTRQADK